MKLSPSDASALLSESVDTPMHTAVLAIFNLPNTAGNDYLLKRYATLKGVSALREPFNLEIKPPRLPVDLPGWKETEGSGFHYQFRHLALPWPGTEQQLAELVGRLQAAPLNQSRPLWECVLIEGIENNRFALYFKTHQALMEMSGVIREVVRWMAYAPGRKMRPLPWALPVSKDDSEHSGGPVAMLFSAYGQALEQAKTVPGLTRALTRLATQAIKKNPQATLPYSAPNSMLNVEITGQRQVVFCEMEKAQLTGLAKAGKVSLQALILASLGSALREYLSVCKGLPSKPLICRTEILLKGQDRRKSSAQHVPVLVNMATHVEQPEIRLDAVEKSLQDAMQGLSRMSPAARQSYSNLLMWPYHLTKLAGVSGMMRPMFNVAIAEYPAQTRSQFSGDAALLSLFPIPALADGHALHIGYRWYAGSLNVCMTACSEKLPDLWLLRKALTSQLQGLKA